MTKKEAQLVYTAAQQMSNWLFNVGQGDKMNGPIMLDMVHKWDDNKIPLIKMLSKRKKD